MTAPSVCYADEQLTEVSRRDELARLNCGGTQMQQARDLADTARAAINEKTCVWAIA